MVGASHQRRRRGSIQLIAVVALALGGLFFAAAMGLDLGRIAWEKRRLQSVADAAALDAVRSVGRCVLVPGDVAAAVRESAYRNDFPDDAGATPNVVQLGSVETVDGIREFTNAGTPGQATAVRVALQHAVKTTLLAGAFLPGDTQIRAESVAARDLEAGLQAGSFLGRVDPGSVPMFNQLFDGMLGTDLDLDVGSYEGLLDAQLTLANLVDGHAGALSVEELLELELSAGEYFDLLANGLSQSGQSEVAATVGEFSSETTAPQTIVLGDLIEVEPGNEEAALDTVFDAFDLVNLGAQVIRGDEAVVLDPLDVTIPGVVRSDLTLKMIDAPKIAVGPPGRDASGDWQTEVETGQTRIALGLTLLGGFPVLGALEFRVGLFVDAARTRAWLEAADCADRADPVHELLVGVEPGVVRMGVGKFQDIDASGDVVAEGIVIQQATLPVAEVTVSSELSFRDDPEQLTFRGPFPPAAASASSQTVGTDPGDAISNALGTLVTDTQFEVEILHSIPLLSGEEIMTSVSDALLPALAELSIVLEPYLDSLGIRMGGADVSIVSFSEERTQPRLVR